MQQLDSLTLLRTLPSDLQTQVAVTAGVCLDCGSKLHTTIDGETVCPNCGIVWQQDNVAAYVPFPEDGEPFENHWSPTTAISRNKALGDTLAVYKGTAETKILAMRNSAEAGLRARKVQLMVSNFEPQQLRRVLGRLSFLLIHAGLGENHAVGEYAGNLCRRLVSFLLVCRVTVATRLADAIAVHVLQQLSLNVDSPLLNADPNDVALVAWFAKTTERFKRLALSAQQQQQRKCKAVS